MLEKKSVVILKCAGDILETMIQLSCAKDAKTNM
jgi:hypothetical protein